jgi:hypothetical protein
MSATCMETGKFLSCGVQVGYGKRIRSVVPHSVGPPGALAVAELLREHPNQGVTSILSFLAGNTLTHRPRVLMVP